jgi:hypothetical protein
MINNDLKNSDTVDNYIDSADTNTNNINTTDNVTDKIYKLNNYNMQNCFNNVVKKNNKSFGIIAIQPTTIDLYNAIHDFLSYIKKLYIYTSTYANNTINLIKLGMYLDNIKFLLVSKKHTYGFTDMVNGKYNKYNNGEIAVL